MLAFVNPSLTLTPCAIGVFYGPVYNLHESAEKLTFFFKRCLTVEIVVRIGSVLFATGHGLVVLLADLGALREPFFEGR